ncbi:MAG TPA: hypothetical protein PKC49_12735 [Phycisphaerae bacterium]|nr:hypothetical protein [Phycisphaerae bacterium]
MSQAALPLKQRGWGQTMRRDAWWVQPLAVFRRPRDDLRNPAIAWVTPEKKHSDLTTSD